MKILLTASSEPDTIAWNFGSYLSGLPGVELFPVYTFDVEDAPDQQGLTQKLIRKLNPKRMTNQISTMLEQAVNLYKPDVLLIVKGMYVNPRLLAQFRKNEIFLVNYNPDHPIYFEYKSFGNQNITDSLPHYHLVCTYSPVIQNALERLKLGYKTAIIPFGYSVSQYHENNLDDVSIERKVCFAGTADKERANQINMLLANGIEVDVYGRGYDRWLKQTPGLRCFPGLYNDGYNEKLQSYAISLNLYRQQNEGSHNMRSFEIPAVGGIQVVEYSEQMAEFFEDGKEVYMYTSGKERAQVIRSILSMSDEQLRVLKVNIRQKTLQAGYSYADRAKEIYEAIQKVI